jgi:hypothetical protein
MPQVCNRCFYKKVRYFIATRACFLRILLFAWIFSAFHWAVHAQEYWDQAVLHTNTFPYSLFTSVCSDFHSEVALQKHPFASIAYPYNDFSETNALILSKEPVKTGFSEKVGMQILSLIARRTLRYYRRMNDDKNMSLFQELQGFYLFSEMQGLNTISAHEKLFFSDTYIEDVLDYHVYVSGNFVYRVDEEQAAFFTDYEAYVLAALMDNFSRGTGPENFVFPENGIISSLFLESGILKRTLRRYKKHKGEMTELSCYNVKDILFGFLRKGSFFNMEGFTGSASISIIPCEEGIEVKIFNISSLTSGALHKEIFGYSLWPESFVRQSNIPTECGIVEKVLPFANISQTFQLFIPYNDLKMR